MKRRLLVVALTALVSVAVAGSARADGIAGWDFSQYFAPGFLTTDAATFVDTLPANYSNLDPTFNAGAESANFGTMYMNGTNGSDQVPNLGTGTETFLPFSGSLASNLGFAPASNPFDSFNILLNEGQMFANLLSMTATDAISVVFGADLSSISGSASDWSIAFGARTLSGATTLDVDFSTDGMNFVDVTPVPLNITDVDALYTVALSAATSGSGYVRLNFLAPAGGGAGQALIDNVTISATVVPEPGTLCLVMGGLIGISAVGRRRRR